MATGSPLMEAIGGGLRLGSKGGKKGNDQLLEPVELCANTSKLITEHRS